MLMPTWLYHDMHLTGHSITGILHFLNKMPINWYSKKQASVEIVTYGNKFITACTCVNQIADLWLTLHYLSVPEEGRAICLATTRPLLTAPASLMPSYTKDTMQSLSIVCMKLLLPSSSTLLSWMGSTIQLTS